MDVVQVDHHLGSFPSQLQRVTLTDLAPLQLLLGNVLKALTSLSEDVKIIRADTDANAHATAKLTLDLSNFRRHVHDAVPSKEELNSCVDSLRQRCDSLSVQQAQHQAASSRDREVVIQRLAAAEVDSQKHQEVVTSLSTRIQRVEDFVQSDGSALLTKAHLLNQQVSEIRASLNDRTEQLEALVLKTRDDQRKNADELAGVTASLIERLDVAEERATRTESATNKELSSLQQSLHRVAAEIARSETIQAQVTGSLAKLVESASDRRMNELRASVEAADSAWAKKLQHLSTVVDVRVDGLREHLVALANEVADVKSEVSSFAAGSARVEEKMEKRLQMAATRGGEKEAEQAAELSELRRSVQAVENSVATLHDKVHHSDAAMKDLEQKWKQLLQTTLERHDQKLLDGLLSQQHSDIGRLEAEVDAVRSLHDDSSTATRLRLAEQQSNLRSLLQALFIDPQKVPQDAADRVRYIRSLPWFGGPSAAAPQTPTIPAGIPSSPPRDSAHNNVISPTLGIEVRNLAKLSSRQPHKGVEVVRVVPDGPAHNAGLREGDIIVGVADSVVDNVATFSQALRLEAARGTETPRLWLRREGSTSIPSDRHVFA